MSFVTPSSAVSTRNAAITLIHRKVTLRKQDGVELNLKIMVQPVTMKPDDFATALATAQHIADLSSVEYPEGIERPHMDLNENTQAGRFRYEWKSNTGIYLLSI